ncbi:MAG: VOC family protein [Acidobacteriota bacterium]|nr:VOC family protein [Acidobacteriota bacterium]
MKLKFDCVFYYVSDIERAIRFYTDVLGFKVASRDFVARFEIDGVLVEIVPTTDASKLAGGGNARLCLQVDDIAATLLELQHKGVPTTPAHPETGGLLAAFQDPDGNEICLWRYTATGKN